MPARKDSILGLDMGGVVTNECALDIEIKPGKRLQKSVAYLAGAINRIHSYVETNRFREVLFLSKTNTIEEHALREMLYMDGFWEKIRVPPSHLHCCESVGHKARLARWFYITHFVDNRLSILRTMNGVVEHRFLFCPSESDLKEYQENPSTIQLVMGWTELDRALKSSLRRGVNGLGGR